MMSPQECPPHSRITLIPGFAVSSGSELPEFGMTAAKLLAFLALQGEPTERTVVAGSLWPVVHDARATANLRTVLWRISQLTNDLIVTTASKLDLHSQVEVDHRCYERLARQVLIKEPLSDLVAGFEGSGGSGHAGPEVDSIRPGIQRIIQSLTGDLLTHWYDDWLGLHQERWRQLRLHALDSLSIQLTEAGYHAAAVDAATAAVAAEPLRESAYRSLMMAHLAEGNVSEATLVHERYCTLLESELGIAPSLQMYELFAQITAVESAAKDDLAKKRPKPSGRRRSYELKTSSARPNLGR